MTNSSSSQIQVIHGAGGTAMGDLIEGHILPAHSMKSAGSIGLDQLDDGATVDLEDNQTVVITTDSHVVKPLFFPGGDIGKLAVCGTINDLSVMGARPVALTSSLIIEQGFPFAKLDRILESMEEVLVDTGTPIVTGDTKVMEKGDLDSLVINTTGIGVSENPISDAGMEVGNKIILTGSIGDHGMALMQHREGLNFETDLISDIAPLYDMLAPVISSGGVTAMKDPTRGGVANALNEMASKSEVGIVIEEELLPVKESVKGIAQLLGLDPLQVANEGKAIIAATSSKADSILRTLRSHKLGKDAAIVGRAVQEWPGKVVMETTVGGRRFVESPIGDPVPRIC